MDIPVSPLASLEESSELSERPSPGLLYSSAWLKQMFPFLSYIEYQLIFFFFADYEEEPRTFGVDYSMAKLTHS